MTYRLTGNKGPLKGVSWPIADEGLIIGRSARCDVIVPDPYVSREHFQVYVREGEPHLRDLGSLNEVKVNNQPTRRCVLHAGDEVCVGCMSFVVTANVN